MFFKSKPVFSKRGNTKFSKNKSKSVSLLEPALIKSPVKHIALIQMFSSLEILLISLSNLFN